MNILQAIDNQNLFAPWFKRRPASWLAWRVFLCALFALPMTPEQLELYRQCTGRNEAPTSPASEGWLICGRRSGKSFMLALIAVFLACFKSYREHLAPGERATIMIVASDRKQSRVIMRYIRALLTEVSALRDLVESETQESFDLSNGVVIEVHTASFRSTRGYTLAAALLDELAFWRTDENSAEPDKEVVAALRPGMATIPGAILLGASSPYARKGELFNAHRKHFGHDHDPVLIWKAATRTMNPTVPKALIDAAYEADPASAAAEYGAEFRSDLEAYVTLESVLACVRSDVRERPPMGGVIYRGFVDPSGGRHDAMTVCVGHFEFKREAIVIDCLREFRPPFSPEAVVSEMATLLKTYRIYQVQGDKYAGLWPSEQFSKFGIRYEASARAKSELYTDLLPLVNSTRIEMLNDQRLINQLVGLERRTARGTGKDSVDHAPGQHDDVANAVAGCASMCVSGARYNLEALSGISTGDADDPLGIKKYERMAYATYLATGGRIVM